MEWKDGVGVYRIHRQECEIPFCLNSRGFSMVGFSEQRASGVSLVELVGY
jgi:hypothetical protein